MFLGGPEVFQMVGRVCDVMMRRKRSARCWEIGVVKVVISFGGMPSGEGKGEGLIFLRREAMGSGSGRTSLRVKMGVVGE